MSGATATADEAIRELAERYDPEVIDLPGGRARIRLEEPGGAAWDALLDGDGLRLATASPRAAADAVLSADAAVWAGIARDLRGGMDAFRAGRLHVRRNLHLGVGFLAATAGSRARGRLRFHGVQTPVGRMSVLEAGRGQPVLCLHGLGATKASFLPTVAALARSHRVVAMDLPGFGESAKPLAAPYDAAYFARAALGTLDGLGIERAALVGNSMGGRVAIECGLLDPARVRGLALLCPSLGWLRGRGWTPLVSVLRPELGLLQPTPRWAVEPLVRRLIPGARNGWAATGVDEFLRSYATPRGRAAFYAALRNIYLEEPYGEKGFWSRLGGLSADTLFVWGRLDPLVPLAFMKHVQRVLPAARHVELDCGHVPQLERPRETHAAIRDFLRGR